MEVEEKIRGEIEMIAEQLEKIVEKLKEEKLERFEKLYGCDWDCGASDLHYAVFHGVEIRDEKLRSCIKELLNLAEFDQESFRVYACVEDGIVITGIAPITDGVWKKGDHYFVLSLTSLINQAKEKTAQYNEEELKKAVAEALKSLSTS
jgi:hypothetical protein